jgi:hypothetical protein
MFIPRSNSASSDSLHNSKSSPSSPGRDRSTGLALASAMPPPCFTMLPEAILTGGNCVDARPLTRKGSRVRRRCVLNLHLPKSLSLRYPCVEYIRLDAYLHVSQLSPRLDGPLQSILSILYHHTTTYGIAAYHILYGASTRSCSIRLRSQYHYVATMRRTKALRILSSELHASKTYLYTIATCRNRKTILL